MHACMHTHTFAQIGVHIYIYMIICTVVIPVGLPDPRSGSRKAVHSLPLQGTVAIVKYIALPGILLKP